MRDFGNIAIEPKATDYVVEYDLYTCDRINAEGEEMIAEGSVLGRENYLLISARCSCGCRFGTAINPDDNSTASNIECPDCHTEVTAEEYELDDRIVMNRIMQACKR